MKKFLVGSAFVLLISACGGGAAEGDKAATDTPKTEAAKVDVTELPEYQKGAELIAGADCLVCHKVDEKLTGPAYRDVANKYENNAANVDMLAAKVISGGKGVWGEVAMTPHPQISTDDAKAMVTYILLLRNK